MIHEFPPLNEAFARYAKNYLGGNVLYFIDGSGGMTASLGNVNPNPVTCTLESALAIEDRLRIKTSALYWGEPSGPLPIDLKSSEETWMRQMPNMQTMLEPSLIWLEDRLRTGHVETPLHIIIVSDGVVTDDPNKSMEIIDRLRRMAGVAIDIVITEQQLQTAHNLRAPLSALAATLNRMDDNFPVGITHATTPEQLKDQLRDFINSRMEPEGSLGVNSERCFAATLAGAAKPVKPMATLTRWKKP